MHPARIASCGILAITIIASCRSDNNRTTSTIDSTAFALDTAAIAFDPENEWLGLGEQHFGDLDSMITRRRIRALVAFTHVYYYIDGNKRKGIAYEAINLFEKSLNHQLHLPPGRVRMIFMPVNRSQVIPLLQNGYADFAFAGTTITEERKRLVDFSIPEMDGLKEVIVGGLTSPKLSSLADLAGKEIYLRGESSYETSVKKLSDSLVLRGLPPIIIRPIDPYLETEDILSMVNSGAIPFTATIADAALLWSNVMDSLIVYDAIPLAQNVSYGWVFRKDSPKLRAAADKFLIKNRKGTLIGNMLYNKYVKSPRLLPRIHDKKTIGLVRTLRSTFQKYGNRYKLDWLLLVAQGYQESGLRMDVVSSAGAVGIMQVLPTTAAGHPLFIKDIKVLDNNVHAGVKYMRFLVDHYFNDPEIDELNRHLLALGAYNCGPGRMAELRKKAVAKGLNPNLWFDNIEIIAAQDIGNETVQYVSNIYKFYAAYTALDYYLTQRAKPLGNKD